MKSKKAYKIRLKPQTIYSIAEITFFLIAGLIIVSFSRQGKALIMLNDILVSYLSWSTVFLPFIFLSMGLLVSRMKTPLAQPNVIVGTMLFFVSLMSLFRAGQLGKLSWLGISNLVTGVGAGIILIGTTIVGIVVMFNTSLDKVFKIATGFFLWLKHFVVADKTLPSGLKSHFPSDRKEMKVLGGNPTINTPQPINSKGKENELPKAVTLQEKLVSNVPGENKVWNYPSLDLLVEADSGKADRGDIKGNAGIIEQTLESFGVRARVIEVNLGPAVTQYALEVALGTKLSKITALERDLALALAATTGTIRIEAPIPGRSLVGIELPNMAPEFVNLKKMLISDAVREAKSKLTVSLGLDVSGKPIAANLGKMPHVLIAGQTGSGKSVAMNAFLATLLYRASPAEVKLILVDPKRVELTNYNGIPHLLTPVIVEPDKVVSALRWLLAEMDRRYKLFAEVSVRNIDAYNEMSGFQALPYIVLVIDELADIMLFAPVEVEDSITRLAQMSRATGIHMVLATQRPSVNVITGLIKANIPCRIAFAVASQIDSRVILDTQGAEKLLGKGDMLYLPPEQAKPMRIQGAFVSDKEVNALTLFLKNQGVTPQYTEEVTEMGKPGVTTVTGLDGSMDDLFADAVRVVCQYDRASASLLQRRLSVGYARAARIIDQLEQAGVVGAPDGPSKARQVLIQNVEEFLSTQVKGS